MSHDDRDDYPSRSRGGRTPIDCEQCGGTAGYHDEGRTYGDPYDCYPPETSVEVEEDGHAFCSEKCLEEWHEEHDEPEEEDEDEGR
jgi:hypothetical protein